MSSDVCTLIGRVNQGDKEAKDQLISLLYSELKSLAENAMRGERKNHTLQATALVNEAVIRLSGVDIQYEDRLHFIRLCASTMRRLLVDYARARSSGKRDGAKFNVTFNDSHHISNSQDGFVLINMDKAINRLHKIEPRKAEIVELHFFSGMEISDIAKLLDISESTATRDIRFSKAWIKSELGAL